MTVQFALQNYDVQSCAVCRTGPHKWLWAILLQIGPAIGGSQLTRSGAVAVDVEVVPVVVVVVVLVVVAVVAVVAWTEHKCGGGFLSKKLHLEAPLPASEPASSKLKVCQLTVQGSSPPGQTWLLCCIWWTRLRGKTGVRIPKENGQPYQKAG